MHVFSAGGGLGAVEFAAARYLVRTGDGSPPSGVVTGHQGDVPASFAANGDQEWHQVVLLNAKTDREKYHFAVRITE